MSTYFHAKPHCCGPDWLQGCLRLTPDSLLALALREIRHKAVFLEVFLCSPCSGLTGDVFLQNIWQLVNARVGSHKTNATSFSSVKVLNIYWTFFLKHSHLRWVIKPFTNTDSICPSAIHLALHHILPLEATPSKQRHTQIIHYVNCVIGTSMSCEWPWQATGTQRGFTAETGKGRIGQQVRSYQAPSSWCCDNISQWP